MATELESVESRFNREWAQIRDDRKTRGYDLRSTERKNRDFADREDNLDPAWTDLPAVSVLPVITGTAEVGETLTATDGTWSNSPDLSRRWLANGEVIEGETGTTFVPDEEHVGATITVEVLADSDDFGQQKATSLPTGAVVAEVV